jgi:hypothetical protein
MVMMVDYRTILISPREDWSKVRPDMRHLSDISSLAGAFRIQRWKLWFSANSADFLASFAVACRRSGEPSLQGIGIRGQS